MSQVLFPNAVLTNRVETLLLLSILILIHRNFKGGLLASKALCFSLRLPRQPRLTASPIPAISPYFGCALD